ncbi:type II toxin-antitoxin system Phd/YefM family antitoxin [Endozoicomonas sp.]|uniref:type II toxin-antitoxin system Phd/YefM family antitoxin n=1 Tax=Endozoicomonas sp. TaxID=1892382 RepID=UPI002884578A|nr:type II toxin-antitoxin system Phd/YefM family antitoxin [Endozoicomonas sp.]
MNEPNQIMVGMHEAKTRLSELVRMALEDNADIIITQRKKPVMRLVPYDTTGNNRGLGLKGKISSHKDIANTPDSITGSFYPDNSLDNSEVLKVMEEVKATGQQAIITSQGKPSLVIKPCNDASRSSMEKLQGTVLSFDNPTAPVAEDDWEAGN